ncbi:molecular chaperone HtpG, partial [bacterium]|nr:molecular chaperone HtpG [bacterium]
TLIVNPANPLVSTLQNMAGDPAKSDVSAQVCRHLYDLALMSQKPLTGAEMNDFVSRSTGLLTELLK